MSRLSFHLPAYSPMSLRSLGAAAVGTVGRRGAAGDALCQLLCREYSADRAFLTGSGAQALQLAIRTARAARADRPPLVGLPAYTCFEVASAAIGAGVRVALYDVDPRTLSPEPAGLRRVLSRGPAAVVVSPLFGVPVDWSWIAEAIRTNGAVLIEDAAQGAGGRWRGRPLGSEGDMSVLSFGRGKGWSGVRGGGLLLRGEFASEGGGLQAAGAAGEFSIAMAGLAQLLLGRPSVYRLPRSIPWLGLGQTRYHDPVEPAAMPRLATELVMRSRAAAEIEAEARRRNAQRYLDEIRDDGLVEHVRGAPEGQAGYLRFPVRLRFGIAGFASRPTRLGIEAGYPLPLAELPQLRARLVNGAERFPGAAELAERLVTLPTHSRLSDQERGEVIRLVQGYRDSCRGMPPAGYPSLGPRFLVPLTRDQ